MHEVKLGEFIDKENMPQRDAVHVAVVPVIAAEKMFPGVFVRFAIPGKNNRVVPVARAGIKSSAAVGIIDPFLTEDVSIGQACWMFLLPNTVTGMRHHWSHPAFPEPGDEPEKPSKSESMEWLKRLGRRSGMSAQKIISACCGFADHGDWENLDYDTPEILYDHREEMWFHVENITGEQFPERAKDAIPFSCAC